MASGALTLTERREGLLARAGLWMQLVKPRIALMVLLTVAVSAAVADWGAPDALVVLHTLLGTAVVAASAGALNQWLEIETDGQMPRTALRPLVTGRLSPGQVLGFGLVTIALGTAYLAVWVRPATAAWALATWICYVGLYTPLKRFTPQNTAIGAVAGALPVLIGWSATGAPLGLGAAVLFLMLYLWQFPHFMAIAWLCRDEYHAAGLQMLSVVDPSGRRAGLQAVVAALALLPVSLLPATLLNAGLAYCLWNLALGLGYVAVSLAFAARREEPRARLLMRYSLMYLPSVLAPLALVVGGR